MNFGSNLARQYEYDKLKEMDLNLDIYSPVLNKSINDKKNMTVEENNCLAEKITIADLDRLWNSDIIVMCPEQHAIGSLCETGALYGWKYMAEHLLSMTDEERQAELERISDKDIHCHYFDIRTNGLPEVDWRRSFSINQLLYGMILDITHNKGIQDFDNILEELKKDYSKK